MDTVITIEALEQLAAELESDNNATRTKLLRLIKAYARIINAREPDQFPQRATEYADVDGHWDNSYPPKQEYKAHNGPHLLKVRGSKWSDIATSSGFYYEWKRVSEWPGLYVSRAGLIYGAEQTGTGRVGQFAAHPGDCDVNVTIEYSIRYPDEITIAELREVEEHLRKRAFPLSQGEAA